MKRIALALALVAMASAACKKAEQAQTSDTTHMMADSTKMSGDTTHMMADSAKKQP
jgi:hypothetical protein